MKRTQQERIIPVNPVNQFKQERDMKVTLTTVLCGPEGNGFPGTVLDIPNAKTQTVVDSDSGKESQVSYSQYLIDNKFARPYDQQKDGKARQQGLVKAER